MKHRFRPTEKSVIISLNYSKLSDDLESIGTFYDGEPTRLLTVFREESFYSYQLEMDRIKIETMYEVLKDTDQESILTIDDCGCVSIVMLGKENALVDYLGKFRLAKPHEKEFYTLCCTTNHRFVIE